MHQSCYLYEDLFCKFDQPLLSPSTSSILISGSRCRSAFLYMHCRYIAKIYTRRQLARLVTRIQFSCLELYSCGDITLPVLRAGERLHAISKRRTRYTYQQVLTLSSLTRPARSNKRHISIHARLRFEVYIYTCIGISHTPSRIRRVNGPTQNRESAQENLFGLPSTEQQQQEQRQQQPLSSPENYPVLCATASCTYLSEPRISYDYRPPPTRVLWQIIGLSLDETWLTPARFCLYIIRRKSLQRHDVLEKRELHEYRRKIYRVESRR